MMEVADYGDADIFVNELEGLHDLGGIMRVQRGNGFICQHQFRLLHQDTGDGHALLLPLESVSAR